MSNASITQGQGQSLTPLDKLIRANHLASLACLTDEQKRQYAPHIQNLWNILDNNPDTNSPERMAAHRRLSDLSNNLRQQMMKYKAAQQTHQQLQNQQQTQQQQGQPQPQAQPQVPHPSQQQEATQKNVQQAQQGQQVVFSDRVKELANALQVILPPQIQNRPRDDQHKYINMKKREYATALSHFESAQNKSTNYDKRAAERHKQQPLTPEQRENVQRISLQLKRAAQEARTASLKIKASAEGPQVAQASQASQASQAQQPQVPQQSQQPAQQQQTPQPHPPTAAPQIKQEPPQAPVLKKEPDAGENSALQERPATATVPQPQPATSQATAPQTQHQTQQSRPTTGNASTTAKPLPAPISVSQTSAHGPPSAGPVSSAPHPLSHQMALDRAAQNHNPNAQQPSHGHPAQISQPPPIQRESSSSQASAPTSRPPQRPLNINPPQPVTMASARPTLPGGPGMAGPQGQPGIQKPPGYTIEGEGDRVMSKNKLDDLIRQVTGGTPNMEGEKLDPEVEQTLLDVADEFVDNVITQACRLAKLRGSTTLELRDMQLILERNYNIRVPGFASDELRTVRKIQPTQAWTQKMSAVQAAKVTGGKADI